METYIALVLALGNTRVDNFCQYAFYTPYNQNKEVVEVCEESVWERVYFNNK